MPLFVSLLTIVGLVLLTHAIYSAHEHSTLAPTSLSSSTSNNDNNTKTKSTGTGTGTGTANLPADIVLETLLATLLLCYAIVAAAPPLRLIRWAEWGGKIEREGWVPGFEDGAAEKRQDGTGAGSGVGNPYRVLEERRGFWDVRAVRKAFADFIREGEER